MEDVIPERLMHSPQIAVFMSWLRALTVAPESKKQLLLFWCDRVGVKITSDMVKRSGIE